MSESAGDEMDELVKEFLVESHENLDRLDRELLILEQNPASRDSLASIFRTIHTIKGTCGFLGFARLEAVAHAGESLLSRLRDGALTFSAPIATALLRTVDAIREMLAEVEQKGSDGDRDYAALVVLLHQLQGEEGGAKENDAAPAPPIDVSVPPAQATPAAPPTPTAEVIPHPPELADGRTPGVSDGYVRVDVGLLDRLMNLVGELVLARNQVLQFVPTVEDHAFTGTTQRLNLITTELQSSVMKTRMQPIGNVWDKTPRIVRDLALALGKRVRVEMEGKETELDKTIIEAIKDPLTHIVRNCVDHGIEPPEARTAQGKPAEGRLFLRAFHEGGQVNIEISDDGAGLNLDRIRSKALERGLITGEQAGRMGDRELAELVFLPGFSTAEKVSNVSGRGVGMDVVKTNIERIGGVVDLTTRPGHGTTFRIKIPLTLAIIPALIVSSGGDRYAIPQVSLLELVRLHGAQVRAGIESVHGAAVCRLRGTLLPLVDLNRELGLDEAANAAALAKREAINIVVLQADNRRFGLVVDDINDTEEIVVKSLGKHLKGVPAFAGATIMGDGRVALILDVLGLALRAKVVGGASDRTPPRAGAGSDGAGEHRTTLLLFTLASGRRMAVPLSMLARLEVFDTTQVEPMADGHVVQYRGDVLPLVDIEGLLQMGRGMWTGADRAAEQVHVLVHGSGHRTVGLVVRRIVDIIDESVDLRMNRGESREPGIRGCVIIEGRVTELLDLDALMRATGARLSIPGETTSPAGEART